MAIFLLHIIYWCSSRNNGPSLQPNFPLKPSLLVESRARYYVDVDLYFFHTAGINSIHSGLLFINGRDWSTESFTKAWGSPYLHWASPSRQCEANWSSSRGSRWLAWQRGRVPRRRLGGTTTTRGTRRPATRWIRGGGAKGCCKGSTMTPWC